MQDMTFLSLLKPVCAETFAVIGDFARGKYHTRHLCENKLKKTITVVLHCRTGLPCGNLVSMIVLS